MSTTDQQHERQPVVMCGHPDCDRAGRPWEMQHGEYCSRKHWEQAKGRKALSGLKYSHTRCFSCLAELKDIEPPKPDWAFQEVTSGWTYDPEEDRIEMLVEDQDVARESACGYQSLTTDATIGEKRAHKKTVTGAVCGRCGSAVHSAHIHYLADGHRTAARIVAYLTAEDDHDFDAETLHRRYAESGDIERATGAAILAAE